MPSLTPRRSRLGGCALAWLALGAGCTVEALVARPVGAEAFDDRDDASAADTGLNASRPATGTWVHLWGGNFWMGCAPADSGCDASERPRHQVTVWPFSLQSTEVSQASYREVVGANPSQNAGACDDCPVNNLSWVEAQAFCAAIGARLPSEAEWEYAARADTEGVYPCGDDPACLDAIAWHASNSGPALHPVGTRRASAWGLYDMLGNIFEWVADCAHADYQGAPTTGEVWFGWSCDDRVARGGSYLHGAEGLRASSRLFSPATSRAIWRGVRCARDVATR